MAPPKEKPKMQAEMFESADIDDNHGVPTSANQYERRTKGGYKLDEAISSLQKFVRRGMEYEACWMGKELCESGFEQYCWRRVLCIAVEDCFGDPMVPVIAWADCEIYFHFKKTSRSDPHLCLTHALLYMCRCKKSRETDHLACTILRDRANGIRLDIPDFCLDKHTRQGRAMGRGQFHFWDEASKLENEVPGKWKFEPKNDHKPW